MKKQKCCICGKEFNGFGNNPWPIKEKGVCCDNCNISVVCMRLINSIAKPQVKKQ